MKWKSMVWLEGEASPPSLVHGRFPPSRQRYRHCLRGLSREQQPWHTGGMKQSTDRPGTLKATSSIVHASSILVLVWLMAISPKRNSVTTECPEWAIMIPSTGRPFTSGLERMRISTELEDEAVLPVDFLLSYAPSIGKQTSSGSRIQTLKTVHPKSEN
nr:hypothetical protein Iba_chr06eCG2270 [Ipomoea batatas]